MPLTAKGEKILAAMKREYGKRGEQVFYASKNAGKITGIDRAAAQADEDDFSEDEAHREGCRIWEQFGNKQYCEDIDQQVSKTAAQYTDEATSGDHCGVCAHFIAADNRCQIVDGTVSPGGWCKFYSPKMAQDHWAFDAGSVREFDQDGRLHISLTPISKANVCPYTGEEIQAANPGKQLGLIPDKIYRMLRHPDELKKGTSTANGVQMLMKHVGVNAENHQPYYTVGATGTDAEFDGVYVKNSMVIWAKDAIDDILSEEKKEISPQYYYEADMTPGVFNGEAYDGVMRQIRFNAIALVPKGRTGPDVCVADAALSEIPYDRAERAFDDAEIYLEPGTKKYPVKTQQDGKWVYDQSLLTSASHAARMAGKDEIAKKAEDILKREFSNDGMSLSKPAFTEAKGDSQPASITTPSAGAPAGIEKASKAYDSKEYIKMTALSKTGILTKGALHAYLRPRVAADAAIEIDPFLIGLKAKTFAEKKPALIKALEAEFGGRLAKDANLNALSHVLDIAADKAEEYKDDEEDDDKDGDDKDDNAKDGDDKEDDDKDGKAKDGKAKDCDTPPSVPPKEAHDMVTKDEMMQALRLARDETIRIQREIREAEQFISPWTGALAITFDSVDGVYRHALKMLGCQAADSIKEVAALKAIIEMYPKPGAAVPHRKAPGMAADAGDGDSFFKMYPDAKRLFV